MSRSRGKLHLARICPWCGTPTLRRDYFTNERTTEQQAASGPISFICDNCFTGFTVKESPRTVFVQHMYARDRQQRPPENEHRTFVGSKPLTERSVFELQRIAGVLRAKRPRSQDSKEHLERCLVAVEGELEKRGLTAHSLTYKIGEIFPPGSLEG